MVIKNHQITNWPNDLIHSYFRRPLVTSNSCSSYQTLFNWDLLNFWPIELSCRRTSIPPVTLRQNHRLLDKFMIVEKLMETALLTINLDGGSMLVLQPIWTVNTTTVVTMANLSVMVFIGANGLRFVMRYVQRKLDSRHKSDGRIWYSCPFYKLIRFCRNSTTCLFNTPIWKFDLEIFW